MLRQPGLLRHFIRLSVVPPTSSVIPTSCLIHISFFVIPAEAGIQEWGGASRTVVPLPHPWIPASAGMTKKQVGMAEQVGMRGDVGMAGEAGMA